MRGDGGGGRGGGPLIGWGKWRACCDIVGSSLTAVRPQTVQEVALIAPILPSESSRTGRQRRTSDWLPIKYSIFWGGGFGGRGWLAHGPAKDSD